MKRFYLMLCFLMSIIGSAWGQETVVEKPISIEDLSNNEKYSYSYSDNYISTNITAEAANKYNGDGEEVSALKLNKDDGERKIVVTPVSGVTITKLVIWGVEKGRPVRFTYDDNTTTYNTSNNEYSLVSNYNDERDKNTWKYTFEGSYTNAITIERGDENNFHFNKIEVTYTYTPITTYDKSFSISDFNYVTNRNAISGIDREAGGFTFAFSGGDGLKCNNYSNIIFRTRSSQNGAVTITSTTDAKIMVAEFTVSADITGNYIIKDGNGNDITSSATVSNNVVTLSLAEGVSTIVFAKNDNDANYSFELSAIKILTDAEVAVEKVTETLAYSTTAVTLGVGDTYTNQTLTSTPQTNFAANKYISSNESIATVNETTGKVTAKAAGTATITASFSGNDYYNATNSVTYTVTVKNYIETPWTISDATVNGQEGKKLTINSGQNGLLKKDKTATLDGYLNVTFAGQNWNIGTSKSNHLNGGSISGSSTSGLDSNNKPNGAYLQLVPQQDGVLTLDACYWRLSTIYVRKADGTVVAQQRYTAGNHYGDATFSALLKQGETYYVYIDNRSYDFELEAITFTTPVVDEAINYNIADFNYNAGTSVYNGLDRKGVCGLDFTFTGDANSPKFNNVENGLNVSSQSSILTIGIAEGSDILANSENKIVSVNFTKPDGSSNDGSLVANVEGEWDSGVFTPTTPAAEIAFTGNGSDFKIGNMAVTTLYEKNKPSITPVLTFEKEAVEAVVGATLTNPLTVKNGDAVIENFRVVYTVSDETVAKIEEEHGTATITPLKSGTVTVTATFDGKRWGDASQNNNIYSAAEKTFTLTVIDETVEFANSEVVFAVNTNKAYTAATGDDGKVTYTALEGNVNAATSTASNAMTYTSSDENLIKVNAETGELSLGDNWTAGKAVTITATSAAGQTATYTVKLKFETSISFGDANGDGNAEAAELMYAHLNVGFVEPKATIVPAGVNLVTYSSNNPSVATVIENTGEVTFPASEKGYATITATIPDNEYYMGSSAQYQIVVGDNVNAGKQSLTDYQIVSYQDSKYTANTGHKFTVANATVAKKIISGEQFTNVPGIELTFGAYTGLGDVNAGDLHNLGTTWTLGEDKYLAHETAAMYDEETNLPIGGYMAFEPVVSGILTMDLTWYKGQTFVLVDKSTNAIVESYTAGSEYAGEHRFSTPLQAGRTYYLYNKGGKVDGEEVNGVMKFRSASFTPVFLDKVTSIIPSKLTDGKVMFGIKGADYYNGSSVIPSLSTARHDHDDITYKLSDGTYLNMTADGVFEILEAMEGNNNAVTVTITANIEAKTAAPNDDTDGDTDHMHSSVAVCQVTYTKSDIKFAKESIDVTLFAENKGADIVEPALNYTKDDVAYASSNTNAFTVNANTGNLTVGTNPSGETTITATVNNDDILRYYTNSSAQYKINCKNYSHVKINQTEVEMTVGETGVNILRRGFIEVVHEHLDQLYRQYNETTLYGDKGKRKVYKTAVVDQFVNNGVENDVNTFFVDATKTNTGKNNGSANTNILYVSKVFTMDAKAAGTTTVYVNLEKLAYSKNGQDEDPTIEASFDAVTIPIKVTIKPREFNAENATLRVWDFTKEIDATTLNDFASSNSTYWTYNESDNTVKTSVIKPTENEDAKYYEEYDGDKAAFLVGKKAFENHEFDLSVFNETLEQEGSKDVLKLSTYNQSNYDYYTNEESGRQHNHNLNIVSDITLNKKSTIKDNNYMPPVDGSNTNLGENSDVCYRGINLEGKASFLHVPKVDDNISIMMIADHNSDKKDDYLGFASSGSNQAGLIVGPYQMTDGTYAAGYNYNRLTTVVNYAPRTDENGIVTEVAVEPAGDQVNVVSVVAGYIATSGILNKGEGKVPTSADTRTDGYTTVVSPYNIDMTGQKVVKAYICDYYGKTNNKVHMKQIKHIPANTPVMLRGYARDLYALFISEGNKAVDPGVDESFIKNNRLRGNATEDMYVPLEETEVNSEGEVVKYYNYGLSGSKWVKFGVDGTMKAGKAYLRLTEDEWADLQEAMISSAGVSATRLSFEFEDLDASDDNVSTGIVQVGTQKDVAGDGYYYSINGVRMGKEKPASKGVYIYNGRKIVIK